MEAFILVCTLHSAILRTVADKTGVHFQGLQQAGRSLRKSDRLSPKTFKKMQQLDTAYNLLRHITSVSCNDMLEQIMQDLDKTNNDNDHDEDKGNDNYRDKEEGMKHKAEDHDHDNDLDETMDMTVTCSEANNNDNDQIPEVMEQDVSVQTTVQKTLLPIITRVPEEMEQDDSLQVKAPIRMSQFQASLISMTKRTSSLTMRYRFSDWRRFLNGEKSYRTKRAQSQCPSEQKEIDDIKWEYDTFYLCGGDKTLMNKMIDSKIRRELRETDRQLRLNSGLNSDSDLD